MSAQRSSRRKTGTTTHLPGLRGRLVLRFAGPRVAETRAGAEQISAQKTAARINRQFDQAVARQVERLNRNVLTQIAKLRFEKLGLENGLGPKLTQGVHFRTTPTALEIVVLGKAGGKPKYASPPQASRDRPDVEVYVHAALVQRVMASSAQNCGRS